MIKRLTANPFNSQDDVGEYYGVVVTVEMESGQIHNIPVIWANGEIQWSEDPNVYLQDLFEGLFLQIQETVEGPKVMN